MKTGRQWLALLSEEEKVNYRNNISTDLRFNFMMEFEFENLYDFISCSFVFIDTPQGCEYWDEIANSNREIS